MSRFYIGIDLGGTNVRIATYDELEKNLKQVEKSHFKRSGDINSEVTDNLCRIIKKVCDEMHKSEKHLAGIGISMAALFDRKTGTITEWPNNKAWNAFPIKSYLEEQFHVPVVLEDDANSAALAEHLVRVGKEDLSLAYITISTGIGAGIIVNNKLYIGHYGWAGEIGHIQVIDDDTICTCGSKGCLQALASGPAILRKFKETKTFSCIKDKGNFELKDVVILAKQGNNEAKKVFQDAAQFIGTAIANMVILFDLPMIVLGGGVIEAGSIILNPIQERVTKSLQNKRKVQIESSNLKDKNGVLGAVALIDKHINGTRTIDARDI